MNATNSNRSRFAISFALGAVLFLIDPRQAGSSCPADYRIVTLVPATTNSIETRATQGGYRPIEFGWGGLAKLEGGEEHHGLDVLVQYKRGETDQVVIHEGIITSTYPAGFNVRQANGDVYELNSNRGEIEKVFVRKPTTTSTETSPISNAAPPSRTIATIDYCSRCAAAGGGGALIRVLEVAIKDRGLAGKIKIDHGGGCRSQCNNLLNVSVRAAGAVNDSSNWGFNSYGLTPEKMKPAELLDDANRIIDEILTHD